MNSKAGYTLMALYLATPSDAATRDYTITRNCGDEMSLSDCRTAATQDGQVRFAADLVGVHVASQTDCIEVEGGEAYRQVLRTAILSCGTVEVLDDDRSISRRYYRSNGTLTIRVRVALPDSIISRLRDNLISQTPALDLDPLDTPEPNSSAPLSQPAKAIRRTRLSVFADAGLAKQSLSSGQSMALVGGMGIQYLDPPLAVEIGMHARADEAKGRGLPGSSLTNCYVIGKVLPVSTRPLRLAFGIGAGVARARQLTMAGNYTDYLPQGLGVAEFTLGPNDLGLRVRAVYSVPRFAASTLPIVNENRDVGRGWSVTLGIALER